MQGCVSLPLNVFESVLITPEDKNWALVPTFIYWYDILGCSGFYLQTDACHLSI